MANNPKHKDNLKKPWAKGQSGNPKGRPPKLFFLYGKATE